MKTKILSPIVRLLAFVAVTTWGLAVASGQVPSATVPSERIGTIEGTFSVDGNGAATYQIELEVPPGTHNVQPTLSLTYNSQRDNGVVGMGWALNGLEAISRCNANQVPNGYVAPVSYNYRDRFCMAGMPLLAVSGEYGYEGTEYRTARDTWTKVVSHGTCGEGPCWFSAQNKDGSVLRFGFTTGATGSRVLATGRHDGAVRVWAQDRFTDTNGNYVAITYSNSAALGDYAPVRIDYTGNDRTGLTPQRSVVFAYELRADLITGYAGGSSYRLLSRLKQIKTYVGAALVKNYVLTYSYSTTTGRSRVSTIADCTTEAAAAADCLPPSRFAMLEPANGLQSGASVTTGQSTSRLLGLLPMDVNGDGKTDFVTAGKSPGSGQLNLTTYLSTERGLGSGKKQELGITAGKLGILGMDVTGDRQGDIVMPVERGSSLELHTFRWAGNGFGNSVRTPTGRPATALKFLPADVDADGIEDLVQVVDQAGKVGFVVYPSSGRGSFRTGVSSESSQKTTNHGFFPLDVNGDGRMDIVQPQSDGTLQFIVYLSDGRAFDGGTATSTGRNPKKLEVEPGDVNGDGKADLILIDLDEDSAEAIPYLGTGTTFRQLRSTTLQGGASNLGISTANLNGDGRADLLQMLNINGKVRLLPLYGNGEAFKPGTALDTQLAPENLGLQVIELNGDGKQDILYPQEKSGTLQLSLVLNTPGQPDLLERITNGLGGEVLISYGPMTDPKLYTKGRGAQYPDVDFQSSLPLVAGYTNSDGRGASYRFTYQYEQGRVGYLGRGWLGFRYIRMIQDVDGRFSEVTYNQTYPGNGLVVKNAVFDPKGVILGSTDLTYENAASASLKDKQINQFVRTSETYSAFDNKSGGARLYTLKKTYAYDGYGNPHLISDLGQPLVPTDDRFTCIRFDNDTTSWQLGYVAQQKVTRSLASCQAFLTAEKPVWNQATDLRWEKNGYDARRNLISTDIWDDSNNVWLTTTTTVDDYGNRLTVTSPAGATTHFTYDATYHSFPVQVTSPPNEEGRTLVDTYAFEPAFGNQTENTDPNGNTFSWKVDAFGQVSDEYGPAPGGGTVRLRHLSWGRDANGIFAQVSTRPSWEAPDDPAAWFWEKSYTDGLLREYRTEERGATTDKAIVNQLRFDAAGQATHTAVPHFADQTPSWMVTTYDIYNRPVTTTKPDGTVQKFDYQMGTLKVYRTDAFGTPEARTEISQFNAYGQVMSRLFANGELYRYEYSPLGELLSINTVPNRRQVTFTYDSVGRLRSTRSADTGTTQYHYDAKGNMTGSTDANGNTVAYTYDALGRVLTVTETTNADRSLVRLFYDGPTSNGKGHLTRAELNRLPLGAYSYDLGYDGYRQTRTVRVRMAGRDLSYGMEYTPLGQLSGQLYPDGARLSVTYGPDANPATFALATNGGPAETYITYSNFNPFGVPLSTLYRNGVETTRTFYPDDVATGKPKALIARKASQMLFGNEYSWNRLEFVTAVKALALTSNNETYTYDKDKLGFLAAARGPYGNESFGYDRVGNRTSRNGVQYTYPSNSDRLSTYGPGTNLEWNDNGTLRRMTTASGTFDFTYSATGRLLATTKQGVSQAGLLAYDFAGNRVFHQPIGSNDKFYSISSDYELAEYANGTVLATRYIDGLFGRAVAITQPAAPPSAAHRHTMGARLYTEGHGPGALARVVGHHALAFASNVDLLSAAGPFLVLALLVALLAASLQLAGRGGTRNVTGHARRRPGFAALVPTVLIAFFFQTAVPAHAALRPGANGAGNPTEGTLFFVQDLVQSTVSVTDGNGQQTASVGYDPFGAVAQSASQGVDNFRPKFTDKSFDADSGLYFFGERYYDPVVGRFTTPDPAAQYLNPYVLAADNPVSQIDPTGEWAFIAVIIIGAVIGAYMGAAAVNHDYNPSHWDWHSGKTYAGLLGGAVIGAMGGALVEVAATAGVAAGIAGAVLVGAGENAAFTAMGGGSAKDILISAAEGAAFGFLFGGAGAALGSLARRFGRTAGTAAVEAGEGAESALARGLRSSCASFLPGTLVATADGGEQPIESLKVGDHVLGAREGGAESSPFPVAATLSGETEFVTTVTTASGATIEATPNHPFWVKDMGWIAAEHLHPGLSLVDSAGNPVALRSVEGRTLPSPRQVYNLSVDTVENYYVSADQALVKNVRGACLIAKGTRRPHWRSAVKNTVFERQTFKSGVNKGLVRSAVSAQRYARSHKVAIGSKGRKVTIWQLDHAKARYQDLMWAANKTKKTITWKNMIEISNYQPNLRYLTMRENVSHAFEPTLAAGHKAATALFKKLGFWK
jgi:RHS repeat-associated protein